jgi:NADPH-dependent 2,4-dienoyl-CoA reductase/sulfur reductase-like enzyme
MFTMIGGGMKKLNQSYKPMEDVLPKDALWLKDKVTEIDPKKNQVTTEKGNIVQYDYMVVATGIELDFSKVRKTINTIICIVIYELKFFSAFSLIRFFAICQIPPSSINIIMFDWERLSSSYLSL